ncbi:hypothetical protein [Peribacillus simplex]
MDGSTQHHEPFLTSHLPAAVTVPFALSLISSKYFLLLDLLL